MHEITDQNSSDPLRELKVEWRPLASIKRAKSNPKKHPQSQISKLKQSLLERGWTNLLLIDDDGNLIAGHGRLEAAEQLGWTEAPCRNLGSMSEAERRAYIIADNRLADEGVWDKELLRSELSGLIELGYDVELTGFDTFEIDDILSFDDSDEAKSQEDNVELGEIGKSVVCLPDDLWKIGEHWLLVGDCRFPEVVGRLLQGERVRMINTDPPYGCRIEHNVSGNGKVKHSDFLMGAGETSLPEFAMTLLRPAFKVIAPHCLPGAMAFVFTDWRAAPHLLDAVSGILHETKNLVVWAKNPGMGAFYRSAHELCYVFKVSPGKHVSNIALGQRNRSNVWHYPGANTFRKGRLIDLAEHPTIKNSRMIADAILDVTKPGDIVFDGFAGSGTTLVACEMTGRRGRAIELDPKYGDVILRRVAEATGCEPYLNGKAPLSEVRLERLGESA